MLTLIAAIALGAPGSLQFRVACPPTAYQGPENVSVVVYLSKSAPEPRFGPDWFNPEPCYSAAFKNAKAGDPLVIDNSNSVGFPGHLADLAPGEYTMQVVVDRNLGGRTIGGSPGNFYSTPIKLVVGDKAETVNVVCTHRIEESRLADTATSKAIYFKSPLLTTFYGRPTVMEAVVALPKEYATEPNRRFPVLYEVPGFGGDSLDSDATRAAEARTSIGGEPFIGVFLNANCPTGHSVFADSENNGPWGKALTTELIPEIDKQFRTFGQPGARYLRGHSSGGWSTLWLQVTYPDVFGGTWSTSPDPVDFRNFQYVDLYQENQNIFFDEKGAPRPIARIGMKPALFVKQFSDMERPIRGEQLGSFEAVFSPRGPDGNPLKLWDRDTGKVDHKVALAWRKYDIDLTLREHWKELGPKLATKLHVYCGSEDTFYLEGAVKLLKADLAALGSDAKVELVPGDHFTMLAPIQNRIATEIAAQFRAWKAAQNGHRP